MIDTADLLSHTYSTLNLLSISSHVVHGKVGNDALQFPLNIRHWNIDCIHTTNFSNHPGYHKFKGAKNSPDLMKSLYDGLKKIHVSYNAAIIGYIASEKSLEVICDYILPDLNANTIVVMDPVMGDHGRMYVANEMIDTYKKVLGKETKGRWIDLLTPNQFEVQKLTKIKIEDRDTLTNAIHIFFNNFRVKNLVITSIMMKNSVDMYCVAATDENHITIVTSPQIRANFSGPGDLFLGILTDEYVKSGGKLSQSLQRTVSTVYNVLKITFELNGGEDNIDNKQPIYIPDLCLVESKSCLTDTMNNVGEIIELDSLK